MLTSQLKMAFVSTGAHFPILFQTGLPGVTSVVPDFYVDPTNKEFGGRIIFNF